MRTKYNFILSSIYFRIEQYNSILVKDFNTWYSKVV